MKSTPEEFPNNIKNPYNQWETPPEFSYYKLLHPPNKFEGYAQVTPLELFSRPKLHFKINNANIKNTKSV
jgi:hypothetical protein